MRKSKLISVEIIFLNARSTWDNSPLSVLGPVWFRDIYDLSPGANALLTLFGAEHMLGGITGYEAEETTDEDPQRVATVCKVTQAYLHAAFFPGDRSWIKMMREFRTANTVGSIIVK